MKTGLKYFLFCFSALFIFAACKAKPRQQPVAVPVNVVTVLKTDVPFTMQYPAEVRGSLKIQVMAQAAGILKEQLYADGAYVAQGTQMFQIDDAPYKAALDKARGQLGQAEADAARTQKDYSRMSYLHKKNAVSVKDYDDAVSAYNSALADLKTAKAGVNDARINLDYTKVFAPISGLTSAAVPSVGALVDTSGGGALLTTIVQIDPLFIEFSIPEKDFEILQQGFNAGGIRTDTSSPVPLTVQITSSDGKIYPQTAQIIFVDNSENNQTSGVFTRASLPNPEHSRVLMPGQFININILGAVYKDKLIIPLDAVLNTPGGDTVYAVKEDNTVEARVLNGRAADNFYIADEGLKEGEKVVSGGLIRLKAGEKVSPSLTAFSVPFKLDSENNKMTVPSAVISAVPPEQER
ncbi:MAG: efflux RND transporter periplasmic adaptor subunit [Elusimicrobia bacterium]|nr:efflux RND transporter periplasmic adaptor subunit [Elusimicrobiota bacterium]